MRRLSPQVRVLIVVLGVLGLLFSAMVSVPLLMVMGSTAVNSTSASDSTACGPTATAGGQNITLDADQLANARTVIQTGQRLNVPDRGLVVAIATALQESTLQNLDWGTGSSVGLFQQITGWGPVSARTDPATAATMFYTGGQGGEPGLLDIPGWAAMTINDAAQKVQASGYPFAYAKWEALATSLVRSVIGNDPLACNDALDASLPTGAVGTMLRTALAQQGKPYWWGAVGPDMFDCSGLVIYSWGQAGYRVQVRTAEQMYQNSTPVQAGSEQPGDLLFGDFTPAGVAKHVMIVVRPGLAVEAPHKHDVVKVLPYSASAWRIGRLNANMLHPVAASA